MGLPRRREDPHDIIEVSLSPLLTGKKRMKGVPELLYPWPVPRGTHPVNSEGEELFSPLLEYLVINNESIASPAYFTSYPALRLRSIPRALIHALYYFIAVDSREISDARVISDRYINLLLDNGGGNLNHLRAERRFIQGAEEVLSTLAPLFFMERKQLCQALGYKAGASFREEIKTPESPLSTLYARLRGAMERLMGKERGDLMNTIDLAAENLLHAMWRCLNEGMLPGDQVEEMLRRNFTGRYDTALLYLADLLGKYSPELDTYEGSPPVPGSRVAEFLKNFPAESVPGLQAVAHGLGSALEARDGGVARWLWEHLPLLNREKMMELAMLTEEYNLEWALAAVDMDNG